MGLSRKEDMSLFLTRTFSLHIPPEDAAVAAIFRAIVVGNNIIGLAWHEPPTARVLQLSGTLWRSESKIEEDS